MGVVEAAGMVRRRLLLLQLRLSVLLCRRKLLLHLWWLRILLDNLSLEMWRLGTAVLKNGSMKDVGGEEQGLLNVKVMCRLCFSSENEIGERARKMMPCKSCGKKYHRSCLKAWGQHRDLFHWSSWTCPSCRLCEGCRRTGDPKKFMFCKRCDAAYHCYCMQPPHKNVSSGPYFCPKHTNCHSCCSNVPGNRLSVRWFLGYTCCDACGGLFVKGNYCPVCLKVYKDSESTPMVCCDICQRWVHCQCDGIRHRGTVVEVFEGSSVVSVALDDGKKKNLELGKQVFLVRSKNVDCY